MGISVGSLEILKLGPSKCMYSDVDWALLQGAVLPTKLALLQEATPHLGGPHGQDLEQATRKKKLPTPVPSLE